MLRNLLAIGAWAYLAFIAYATLSPIQLRPVVAAAVIEHVGAFAVVGGLFCLAYPRHMIFVCLIVLGSAVLLEFAQTLTPDRHGRVLDALEKLAGGALGVCAGRVALYLWPRSLGPS
jgi:hypothetical protein